MLTKLKQWAKDTFNSLEDFDPDNDLFFPLVLYADDDEEENFCNMAFQNQKDDKKEEGVTEGLAIWTRSQ